MPVVPRGGGTGLAGGCVPVDGGVVVATGRLTRVRSFEPSTWFMHADAGVTTETVQRLARENGLFFGPDPGAAEQSQLGGNIATNAGGPHAFKYGVTGRWVTGVDVVLPPGEPASFGGPLSKDVAGYDLTHLLVGSEGTLGIVTAAWLRLLPAPEAAYPVIAFYDSHAAGCAAIALVVGSGLDVAVLEYLDRGTLALSGAACPADVPAGAAFAVIAEADGDADGALRRLREAKDTLGHGALTVRSYEARSEIASFWRWRDGVSTAVAAARGGKVSEDVAVPRDRLLDIVEASVDIGRRHGLESCSWGHAGDGNVHASFLVDPRVPEELNRAETAAGELFAAAIAFGGTISGEHGTGWVKRGFLSRQWPGPAFRAHEAVKRALDPTNLMNPGKKR
jgi:FAD/FMN-containing dehydrogenase